jgi:hypothetical protein
MNVSANVKECTYAALLILDAVAGVTFYRDETRRERLRKPGKAASQQEAIAVG